MAHEFDYLLIDISNSFTKIVPSSVESLGNNIISIPTNEMNERFLEDLSWNSDNADFRVILSSVVPEYNDAIENIFGKERVLEVSNSVHIGCEIDYPDPQNIGADRLANVAAAVSLYDVPALIIDFGTAVTFDVVSSKKSYIGGVIAPGLASMSNYMFDHTALLPRIDLDEPSSIIGKSTEDAMLSGAVIGYRGLVKEVIHSIFNELDEPSTRVIATGGYAQLILSAIKEINIVNDSLTLEGLRIIAGLNPLS
ncbi:MAG: type III pantothenate kinase [Verrucomicrobiota bacterium]|nr:type III pantothenate kinase [Verrucomicrobiota bacterium]